MAHTIPVFTALIDSDGNRDQINHEYFGQLGYALHDSGEYEKARRLLDQAIRLRGDWRKGLIGFLHYEFVRAQCGIRMSEGLEADSDLTEGILADLRVAVNDSYLRDIIQQEELFLTWLEQNNVDRQTFTIKNAGTAESE